MKIEHVDAETTRWACDCDNYVYRYRGQGDVECSNCGQMYNSFGQRLAPVEQWGEETGEHYCDIVNNYDPERLGYPYDY